MEKIIIITHNFPPESVGGASRMYEMAMLLKKFYEVTIICPPPTYPFTKYEKAGYFFHKEIFNGLKVCRVWTYQPSRQSPTYMQRIFYYIAFPFLASFFILTQVHNAKFVIVTDPPSSLLFTTIIIRLLKKRLILDVRDLWIEAALSLGFVNKKNRVTDMMKKFQNYCWKKSDLIITNSLVIADEIRRILTKSNSSKVKYFPFNVDLEQFKRQSTERRKQIVYVGNFGLAQDLETFVKAISIVLAKIPDLKIQMYGSGDREKEIKKLVFEMNLQQYFVFNNPVPRTEIPLILSMSILGIVPLANNEALRYAIPTKTFEYFACGLPVLAYGYSDELERIVRESEGGIFVRGNNYKDIADAIIKMLNNENIIEKYSKSGRKFVEQKIDYSFFLQVS